ncbi:MAG: bacillithiol system redox-active protein YtxJ [Bacteroidota bacterium]
MIEWKNLDSEDQLQSIIEESYNSPQIIFKHSTRCMISRMAKRGLESDWSIDLKPYYLDLITYRSVSNAIAESLEVVHQSPQLLLLSNGKSIYHPSHEQIKFEELTKTLDSL